MNIYDIGFFSINNFISNVKKVEKNKENKNEKAEKDFFIDVNQKYSQESTLENFYKIYEEEKIFYEKKFQKEKNLTEKSEIFEKESSIIKNTSFRFFKNLFFYIFLIRVINVASDFVGPFALGKLLGITTKKTKEFLDQDEKNICYFYIILFLGSNLIRIFTSTIFNYNLNMIRNQINLIVNDLIFKKTLIISKNLVKNSEAKINKFLNEDISTFFCFFINLNRTWELPIEIILAIYGTYTNVSMAFLPGLIFAIFLLFLNYKIADSITSTNKELYDIRLKRQELEITALRNYKNLKFSILEDYFIGKIFVRIFLFFFLKILIKYFLPYLI